MAWDAYAIAIPPLALLACIACIPPFVIQIQARNFAATILVLGIAILNLQNFINALIWASADPSTWWHGKILCDIEVKLYIGMGVAVDGAVASIFRQISVILDTERMTVTPSPRQRKVRLAIEIGLCIIIPTCVMAAHYLVQKERYWLRPSAGCTPSFDNNWVTTFLIYLWPVVSCVVGSAYCGISIYRLWRHRTEMASVLSHTPGVTTSRFFRLFALAFALLVTYCPLAIFAFAANVSIPMHIYSWSYIHPADWNSRIIIRQTAGRLSFDRWGQIATGYLLFGFFGLGPDAVRMYRAWLKPAKGFSMKCCTRRDKLPMTTKHLSNSVVVVKNSGATTISTTSS